MQARCAGVITEHSPWIETSLPTFPTLDRDLDVDVTIVGAGLTGITAAYLLRKAGKRVVLLDRDRVASADTARTTAHLTYVTDQRLHHLVNKFGRDGARAFWEAGAAAIDQIWQLVQETRVECEFRWVSGYLHEPLRGADDKERDRLQEDARLAIDFGFDARYIEHVPSVQRPGVAFANQAKFHPRKYLAALVSAIPGDGSHVFELTNFERAESSPMTVYANGKRIHCEYLVIATHNPLVGEKSVLGATLLQTKLALYTSYVLGARLPRGALPEGLFWDTGDPYEYLRVDANPDHQYAIFGGEDVKTGQEEDPHEIFQKLGNRLRERIPTAEIRNRWMGQVIETADGLPFIGENTDHQFIATGFCGNGFTLGTLAGVMARDRYLGRKNPWFDLLRVDRRPFHGGLWRYIKENADYPYYLLRDRVVGADAGRPEDLAPGEGAVLSRGGRKVAAFRDERGELSVLSPVCTHLKCLVRWNAADQTWDCPCHGSRFRANGAVLSGPAEAPLEKL
jgi:glycine/D-amino acid oxidase-like deaminating enzyme/nitrite reductase/ring-hydroxylating ferredoxin subunit